MDEVRAQPTILKSKIEKCKEYFAKVHFDSLKKITPNFIVCFFFTWYICHILQSIVLIISKHTILFFLPHPTKVSFLIKNQQMFLVARDSNIMFLKNGNSSDLRKYCSF